MSSIPATFPANWQIAQDFDPNDHLMQLKGRDYLNVQARMLWFIRDQRALIASGLAQMPYVVRTELVEQDRERQYAHFRTFVRDVLGNEATMYGSETGKDFADYAEKASTKSLGRALLALGYGTAFAPEMDEGERVVDTPQRIRTPQAKEQPHSLKMKHPTHGVQPAAPFVTLEQCADFAEDHGIDRDAYQRAIAKYGTDKPEYLLAALEVYADRMEERAGAR